MTNSLPTLTARRNRLTLFLLAATQRQPYEPSDVACYARRLATVNAEIALEGEADPSSADPLEVTA